MTYLLISYKYRCIYIRVPKVASSSIASYFQGFLRWHTVSAYLGPSYVGDRRPPYINMFPTYFTFAFVRNPFDRFVSSWLHRFDPNREIYKDNPMCNHSLREYAELTKDLLINSSLASIRLDKEMGPHRVPLCDLGYERLHLMSQKAMVLDYNPIYYSGFKRYTSTPCSFIGRYENLERDFSYLLDILGVPNHNLTKRNVSLSRRVGSGSRHYSDYYDKPTRRLIEEIYADDLEVLGYDFEEAGKASVLNPLYDENIARSRRVDSMRFSVIGALKSYRRRIILLAQLLRGRTIFIRRALLILFIYPILAFFGLYDICLSTKRWLMGQANNK